VVAIVSRTPMRTSVSPLLPRTRYSSRMLAFLPPSSSSRPIRSSGSYARHQKQHLLLLRLPRGGGADGHLDHRKGLRSRRISSSLSSTSSGIRPRKRKISFITDVEGDRDYLARYVNNSRVLAFRPLTEDENADPNESSPSSSPDHRLCFPYDHCIDFIDNPESDGVESCLVSGGDVWDQGGSDLYVVRQFLHLKRRYPDRVFFVLGNRDVNKMRMTSELGCHDYDSVDDSVCDPHNSICSCPDAPPHSGVYWLRNTGSPGDPKLGPMSKDPVERLQWMLRQTMGSPRAFEHRRWELQQERKMTRSCSSNNYTDITDNAIAVRDEDVVESYRRSCHPATGEMGRYLSQACLAVRFGEALFLHGSLPLTNPTLLDANHPWHDLTFAMPWLEERQTARDAGVQSIDDWLRALNDFARDSVQLWQEHHELGIVADKIWSEVGGYNHPDEPHSQLIQYGMGWLSGRIPNPTVVYASWANNGMPRRFFPGVNGTDRLIAEFTRLFFEMSGVRLVCSGHQPQGDMPNTIRVQLEDGTAAFVMSCDTSYSADTMWHNLPSDSAPPRTNLGRGEGRSGRGMVAVSEVLIEQCTETGKLLDVFCHGTLSDGTRYESTSLDFDQRYVAVGNSTASLGDSLVVGAVTPRTVAPDLSESPHHGPWWWTRSAFKDGSYLLTAGEGFRAWNRIVKP